MKIKFKTRTLAAIMSLVLLLTSFPLTVFANKSIEEQQVLSPSDVPDQLDYDELVERGYIERLYDEEQDLYSYLFGNSDGTKTKIYYQYPVKYISENGEIRDKSLNLIPTTVNGVQQFVSQDNDIKVAFHNSLTRGMELQYKDMTLLMTPEINNIVAYSTTANLSDDNKSVRYTLDQNTYIEYSLTYMGVKEDIVVNQYTGRTSYPFLLSTGGFSVVMSENSEYVLIDDSGTIQAHLGDVLIFTADERNNTFGQMSVETIKENELYRLTIQVDPQWLSDENTAYPITIDPTINITAGNTAYGSIEDCVIGSSTTYSFSSGSLYVGRGKSGATIRSLMRFPNLDISGKIITSASVEIRDLMCESDATEIQCYEYVGNSWSQSNSPTWSNVGNNYLGKFLDSHYVRYGNGNSETSTHRYSYDITILAKDWASGVADPESGIVFKASDAFENGTTNTYKTFASIDRSVNQPSLSITYSDAVGLNSSYEYDTKSLGENISIYNNVQYGGILAEYIFIIPESIFPIQPSYIYNSTLSTVEFFDYYGLSSATHGEFSLGWKLNYVELIQKQGSGYLYIDGYGTEYFLNYDSNKDHYELEEIGAVLTVESDNTFSLKIDDIIRTFNVDGLISSLTYENKTYDYQYTNGFLTGIKHNGTNVLSFSYSENNLTSLYYCSAVDGSNITYTIQYIDGNISKILDVYGNATAVSVLSNTFDIYNELDGFGYRYIMPSGRVSGYEYYRMVDGIKYSILSTSVSTTDNRICYVTNNIMTTYCLDAYNRIKDIIVSSTDGKTIYDVQMCGYDENNEELIPVSLKISGGQNLLKSTFAGFSDNWVGYFEETDEKALMGSHSVKLSSNNGSVTGMGQSVYLTAGQYVLSTYVQFEDLQKVQSDNVGGLSLRVTSSSGNVSITTEHYINSPTDAENEWFRIWIPFTVQIDADYSVAIVMTNAIGTAYIDCVQLEKGKIPTTYNCIENSGFEKAESWSDSAAFTQSNLLFGSYVANAENCHYQRIDMDNMSSDRRLIVSGWLYVEEGSGSDCRIRVVYNDGQSYIDIPFDPGKGLQYVAYEVTAPSSCITISDVTVGMIGDLATTAYFDNILLSFGSSVPETEEEQPVSSGLSFISYGDGTCYLGGVGTCTDTDIIVPETSPAGEKVIKIGTDAFSGNTAITSIVLPDTIETIRIDAFENCTSLTSVVLSNNLTTLENRVFIGCTALEEITLPDSLTFIGNYCFSECTSLKSIDIPDSVTDLGDACFYLCTGLEDVTLSDEISVLKYSTFNRCSSLESIVLPDNLTAINNYAFSHCSKLQTVQIPETLTSVSYAAFNDTATNITFYCKGNASVWANITFGDNSLPSTYNTQFNSELMGDMVYTYTYDTNGNAVGTEIKYIGYADDAVNSNAVMFTSAVYDAHRNLLSYTDESGHTTTYTYDRYGNILTKTDASGIITTYTYYTNGLLKSVSCGGQTNTYTYAYGMLSGVNHTGNGYGQSYTYSYNNYGNLVSISVGNQTLVYYVYSNSGKGNLSRMSYANGYAKYYVYDEFGNVLSESQNVTGSIALAASSYDYNGNMYHHVDVNLNKLTRYFEDEYGNLCYSLAFDLDGNQIEELSEPPAEIDIATIEDIYDRPVSMTLTDGDATVFTQNYTYAANGYYSSYELAEESFSNGSTFTYTYNDLGYLTSVKENGILTLSYVYDDIGQLIRENNAYYGRTFVYTYDNGGNMINKRAFAYTTGTVGTALATINYNYGNSNWKDQLTSYNGNTITYDASGNPLKWRNASAMTWTGRQLRSMTLSNGIVLSFLYNADGLRISKTIGDETVKYHWDSSTLLAEEHDGYTVTFLYDGDSLIGFNYNGSNYFYGIDNLGVIHYIYNEMGTVVVTYTYDAWGNVIRATGNTGIINVNPFIYKSYYYDKETGFYYLQSRYYDPAVCRFVNADSIMGGNDDMTTYNLYVYCGNCPTNRCDNGGLYWKELWGGVKKVSKAVAYVADTINEINRVSVTLHAGNTILRALGIDTAKIGAIFLQMKKDNRGVYHATFDCWQQYAGYNNLYDILFNIGTDMQNAKFPFKYNGRYLTIWLWKGNYINLGAGAELGIYRGNGVAQHCYVDKSLAMFMTLTLKYKGKTIIYYPDTTWWITGFNPSYQNKRSRDLQATFKIYFMTKADVYNSFKSVWKRDKRWKFNNAELSAQFTF